MRKKSAHVPLHTFLKKVKSGQDKRALLVDHSLLNKTDQALNMAKTEAKLDEENIAQTRKKHHCKTQTEYNSARSYKVATQRRSKKMS